MPRVRLRISCGSTAPVAGPEGEVWAADAVAEGPAGWGRVGGSAVRRPDILPIAPAAWAGVARSEAFGMSAYRLDLPPGIYAVRLIVAETHPALDSLARTFSVSVCGETVVPALCPAAMAGGFARVGAVRIGGVPVAGQGLELGFSSGATLAGLEVTDDDAGAPRTVEMTAWAPRPLAAIPAGPVARRSRMLVLGHSGSFYWAMPESVSRLVALHRPGLRIDTAAYYAGGKGVRHFLEAPETARLLDGGGHDLVVLQDSSWGPLEHPAEFAACMPRLIERVRAAGAQPVLYAYSGPLRHAPEQRRRIQDLYDAMGASHGVAVMPCAAALALAQEELPDLDLHDVDGHHLGIAGGVLYASCWYRTLCGPAAPTLRDRAVLAGHAELPPALSAVLAGIADRACAGRGPGVLDAAEAA
jgi:hypothetical protein